MAWLFADQPASGLDIFDDLDRLRGEVDRLFSQYAHPRAPGFPPVNVWVGEESVAVTAQLPGVREDQIELNVEGGVLTLQGHRVPADVAGATWHRQERRQGPFSRQIKLPFRADPEHVEARFTDGVLEIELQRPKSERPRKIEIRTS